MLFSLLQHYLDTDTALKVSKSVYCFTTSICHGVENYFPRLWGMGISDAIFSSVKFVLKMVFERDRILFQWVLHCEETDERLWQSFALFY